ncbi:Fanconi anemia core complex-associated 20 [Pelobates cultripes]|uniref:Fanconi anemia core complex-associated 20 n=1 Tax=Pelobates cultripes TaxID=61616 RepID=A0AAD1TAF6_PELCU|nr:Fanconi anemia core complex-associated 20 [Pelobates cultripes]
MLEPSLHSLIVFSLSFRRRNSTGSWFDEIELTAAEQMWRQVLRSANPNLTNLGWESVPSLPDFGNKNTETTSEESDGCDVFNIGQDEFKWVPFPKELPGSPLYQNSGNMQDCHAANNQTESLQDDLGITSAKDLESECSVYQLKSKLSVVKQEIHPPKEISSQNLRRQISGNQALSKMDSTKMFEYDRIQNKSQDLYLKVDTQVQKTENTDIVMKDLEEEDNWGDSEVKETDQSAPRAAENVDLLENCPMCLKQFSKGLSQLDIDSHLAQCLSEATVDVIW